MGVAYQAQLTSNFSSFSPGTIGHAIFRKLKDKILPDSMFEAIQQKVQVYSERREHLKAARALANFAEGCQNPEKLVLAWKGAFENYGRALEAFGPGKHLARLRVYSGMLRGHMALANHYLGSEPRQEAAASGCIDAINQLVLDAGKEMLGVGSRKYSTKIGNEIRETTRYGRRVQAEVHFLEAQSQRFLAELEFSKGNYGKAKDLANKAYYSAGSSASELVAFCSGWHFRTPKWAAWAISTPYSVAMQKQRLLSVFEAECQMLAGDCAIKAADRLPIVPRDIFANKLRLYMDACLSYRGSAESFAKLRMPEMMEQAVNNYNIALEKAKELNPLYHPHPLDLASPHEKSIWQP